MDKEAIARELLAAEISAENHRTATPERGLSHGLVQDTVALRTGGDWPVTVNGEVARRAIIAALTKPAATLSPAEPSPESREAIVEECAKVAEAAQLEFSTRPWVEPYNDGCKDAASAIRALSAPAHD